MPENEEVLLDVRISISIILPDIVSRELGLRRLVQTSCQTIRASFPDGCEATPASGVHPLLAIACSVDVKGDEEHLVFAQFLTECVDTAAALREGDIVQLRNQEPGIETQGNQVFLDLFCEEASVGVFAEEAVRAPLAGSVLAMAIVKKNNHSCRLWFDGKMMI